MKYNIRCHNNNFNSSPTFSVSAYSPDSKFSLSAINRMQIGAGINLLSVLEEKLNTLSDLQTRAGFNLCNRINPVYCKTSQIPKYINSWSQYKSSDLQPTWKNLIEVLKKLKLSVADEIETYLMKSADTDVDNQLLTVNCMLIIRAVHDCVGCYRY